MALNFPSNPTVNQVYQSGTTDWIFDGAVWAPVAIDTPATKITVAPAGTISSITVQGAIEEINSDFVSIQHKADKYAGELSFLYLERIKAMSGLAGYWPADPAYLYEDSGATTPASLNGVVGCWTSLGPSAVQATTANKPYLRKTPTSAVHWLDSNTTTSALTATLGNLGAACTVAQAGAEGVTFTEGVTISSTYNIAPAYGFNGDVAIFDRALTVSEKALLTRYMSRGVPLLGSNLVTNGTFDTDTTGWTAVNSNIALLSGGLGVTSTSETFTCVYQEVAVNSGSSYYGKCASTPISASSAGMQFGTGAYNGTFGQESFRATATNVTVQLLSQGSSNTVALFDDVVLKEIL